MKYIVLGAIKIYQLLASPFQVIFPTAGCRFSPTCSEFTYREVSRRGAVRGVWLGFLRVLKCNPWNY